MGLMTQDDCDKIIEFVATQNFEEDGETHKHWSYRFVNEHGVHATIIDDNTPSDVNHKALRGIAESLIKSNVTIALPKPKRSATPIDLMK